MCFRWLILPATLIHALVASFFSNSASLSPYPTPPTSLSPLHTPAYPPGTPPSRWALWLWTALVTCPQPPPPGGAVTSGMAGSATRPLLEQVWSVANSSTSQAVGLSLFSLIHRHTPPASHSSHSIHLTPLSLLPILPHPSHSSHTSHSCPSIHPHLANYHDSTSP